ETGLYYNRFRYYDKDSGQYISPDPIGLLGGFNPYGYVHNPTKFIDPFGLAGDCCDQLYIPHDANGKPIPLDKQRVNGQDIPLPDPMAEGRAHTVLGGKISSEDGLLYRQSATFPSSTWPTANGKPVPFSEVHWGDHGKPHHHPNPHQHQFIYENKFGWKRQEPTPYFPTKE
ncbi:RHS repeat-associated core domain-containing protein, partial [Providencia manganoxydans]